MIQKSLSEIVHSIINNMHDTLPDIDTKQGTFMRDVIINPISDEIAGVYGDMKLLELAQSVLTAQAEDLDRLASNYFITRKAATRSSGKIRFYFNPLIKENPNMLHEVLLTQGIRISTPTTITKDPIVFETIETKYVSRDISSLTLDENDNLFVEVAAISVDNGGDKNVSAGEITQTIDKLDPLIVSIGNPFPFYGGSDSEDDISLALRINLAISGANIGTKDGYLSYILRQNGVIDAKIISAGDPLMERDSGYIDKETGDFIFYDDEDSKVRNPGKGGKIDIYIRGESYEEHEYDIVLDNDYDKETAFHPAYKDLTLIYQPVVNIASLSYSFYDLDQNAIVSDTLLNAADYKMEGSKYYKDVLWNFNNKEMFPDQNDVPNLDPQDIIYVKNILDDRLKNIAPSMKNISYALQWSEVNEERNVPPSEFFIRYIYNDNQTYKIRVNPNYTLIRDDGTNVNMAIFSNRIFIKRGDNIYVRHYQNPDYRLKKDETKKGFSVLSNDCIEWLDGGKSKVSGGGTLTVRYNFNGLINDLQAGIDNKRVLTADVLVKEAKKIPLEISLTAYSYKTHSPSIVKQAIVNRVVNYIETLKKMGGEFDLSDIVSISRQTDGVNAIKVDSVKIYITDQIEKGPQEKITAKDNEYLKVDNIIVNVYPDHEYFGYSN